MAKIHIYYYKVVLYIPFLVFLQTKESIIYMKYNQPLILISNDDGYNSIGIKTLVSSLADFAEIVVCAPDSARSGYSCAFSAEEHLTINKENNIPNCKVWSCSGTPVDCIKIAFEYLLDGRSPDLIIGGINHGDNSSVNNHYSGTMGIVREGCMKHIPSIAFSSCDHNTTANLNHLKEYIVKIVKRVLKEGLPNGVCLNVNFPKTNKFKGIKVCRMGIGNWVKEVVRCIHPRNYNYYWMVGNFENEEPEATDNDQWALSNGYISITPTKIDITDYDTIKSMKDWETI